MSRIGKLPVKINEGVSVTQEGQNIKVAGPLGELNLFVPKNLEFVIDSANVVVKRKSNDKRTRALHGLWRVLIANTICGVATGWERKLDYKGVGFRAEVQDNKLVLALGFSHPVEIKAPEEINFQVTKNVITVSGIDKQKVGQVAANIRKLRPVEPYKGKGIKYIEEVPRKKLGKAAKAATSTG